MHVVRDFEVQGPEEHSKYSSQRDGPSPGSNIVEHFEEAFWGCAPLDPESQSAENDHTLA
jgi:hypothetical protein